MQALALVAVVVALGSWVLYFRSVVRVQVSRTSAGHLLAQSTALILGVAGIIGSGGSGAALGPGIAAILLSAMFFALYSQRRTPVGELRVAVGQRLLPFAATSSDGTAFHTDALAGRRVLLKFFRGHW